MGARSIRPAVAAAGLVALTTLPLLGLARPAAAGSQHDPREKHLADVRQLTFQGENAEAYWSPDGEELILQATFPPYGCDQIFRLDPETPGELELVSTGKGRTTCAYFHADGERILYASTHLSSEECPPKPDFSLGYVWPIYPSFEIFSARADGSDLVALTENESYDAEATVCAVDGSIVFTSTRDGDLDLYRMDADGANVQRLTETPGYDGGAFFSPDCSQIVWRASRPREGTELDDYRRLLGQGLVRPSKLELWIADADGGNARQITYLDAATFAPYFHPSGERILFSTNYGSERGREFDIWSVGVDGTGLQQITYTPGFDGFPMFSPDGHWLAFASNRNQGKPGETDVYVARWIEAEPAAGGEDSPTAAADRLRDDVAWLADDRRQGRGVGTPGLTAAAYWLADRFAEEGLEPGLGSGDDRAGYLQPFEVPVRVHRGESTVLSIGGESVVGEAFEVAPFSVSGSASGAVVMAGYGITAPELERDDYEGLDVEGKVVLVRRFTPETEAFVGEDGSSNRRRYGDLRYKAWNAREHGAAGVLIVDLPEIAEGAEMPAESPLPRLRIESRADAGLPVMVVQREVGQALLRGPTAVEMTVELAVEHEPAHNVVAKISAGSPGGGSPLVVGAHYDHLGFGGPGSLTPDAEAPHNGADDNASGTAALLEIGRDLMARRASLTRDVYLVGFSGEERGLRGSTYFTNHPPEGVETSELVAMLNLDMVGRLRNNRVSVLGASSASEWTELVEPLCEELRMGCQLGGDGYGPSDQTPFYASGVPVLHFFTGAHGEYHTPADDLGTLNLAGTARIASLVSRLAEDLASREAPLSYQVAAAPEARGDARSYGASLGTIPDYAADDTVGVLLAGTRPEGPADRAGMLRGDRLVELSGKEIRDIYDLMFVLRQAKPGESSTAVVEREGARVALDVVFGQRGSR